MIFSIFRARREIQTAADTESWFNRKLTIADTKSSIERFKARDPVMSNMDPSLQNVTVHKARRVWMLD